MNFFSLIMEITQAVRKLVAAYQLLAQEKAALAEQLAVALSDDVADEEAIVAAQAAAADAVAKAAELQHLVETDQQEDLELEALINSVLPAEPVPVAPPEVVEPSLGAPALEPPLPVIPTDQDLGLL